MCWKCQQTVNVVRLFHFVHVCHIHTSHVSYVASVKWHWQHVIDAVCVFVCVSYCRLYVCEFCFKCLTSCVFVCVSYCRLYVCEFCFKCLTSDTLLKRHQVSVLTYWRRTSQSHCWQTSCATVCGCVDVYCSAARLSLYQSVSLCMCLGEGSGCSVCFYRMMLSIIIIIITDL